MTQDRYLTIGIANMVILILAGAVKTLTFPLFVAEIIFHLRSRATQYWARTAFVVPTVVPAVATILVWRFIYDPNLGLANQFLKSVGLSAWTHSWLGEPGYALGAIIGIGFPWVGAFPLLVLYAGLIAIPAELLEAATVDGASPLRRIWSLHLPLLLSQVKLLLILVFIGGIQDFTGIFILTEGGPLDSTYVPGLELYFNATRFDRLGYASAIGVVLFIVIMAVTIVQLRFVRSATEYQA
jgi:ABC-type sugar transport system permease subunit